MRVHLSLVVAALCAVILAACSQGSPKEEECTPKCDKNCGKDGCGGSCGECDDGLECTDDTCGPEGCYVSIQSVYCVISEVCVPSGTVHPADPCASCQPSHTQENWTAVEDGTDCGAGKVCYKGQCCMAAQHCAGKNCGDDGCGGTCGECGEFQLCEEGKCKGDCDECNEGQIMCADDTKYHVCQKNTEGCWAFGTQYMCSEQNEFCICQFENEDGICIPEGEPCGCQPQCAGKSCGGDGCGGSCGVCEGVNVVCEDGECTCAGDMCGDGCCGANQVCTDLLECCTPACEENDCGEDGCGSVCGMCEGNNVICHEGKCACTGFWCGDNCCKSEQICTGDSVCCTTECGGKDCGDNGCGGVCGVCGPGQLCLNGICPPPGKDCDDGNDVDWDGCTNEEITEFMVNTTVADWQGNPFLAGFSDGRYVVLWQSDKQDGDLTGTFAQRYKADGTADGGEFLVNTTTEDDQHNHAAATFPSGAWVAVWDSFFQDGNGDGVFGQLYNSNSAKYGTEFQVNSHTLSNQEYPDIAVLSDSRFVVVWGGVGEEDWGGVYGRVFEEDGAEDVGEFLVNGYTTGDQKEPAVAALADGGFAVAWVSAYQDGSDMGVYGRVFGADGAPASDEFPVNEFTLGDQEHPDIAATGDGFVIVWQSEGQDNDGFGIIAQRFDPDGTKVGGESPANAWTVDHQRYPSVSSFADGRYAIAWESKEQDGSGAGIFVRLFEADGNVNNPEFQVNTFTDSNQQTPGITVLTDSTFAVAWRSWEQGGAGYDIFAARLAVDGSMLYH